MTARAESGTSSDAAPGHAPARAVDSRGAARPAPRTRRRGAVLTQAIRRAVLDELAQGDYASVTYEGVARRARTSKPVLYRRYPTRAHMVADALLGELRSQREARTTPESTGTLRGDLRRLLALVVEPSQVAGPVTLRALIGDADADLAALIINGDQAPALDMLADVVEQARARAELGPHLIPRAALLAPVGLLRAELLEHVMPPDYLDEVIDAVALPLYRTWSQCTD